MSRRQWLVLGLVVAAVIAFGVFDLGRYLSLESLKTRHADLLALYASRPLSVIAGYFLTYVAVTALSLPGAAVMTLAGGAIFGLGVGTVVVSFASSVGATLAFLVARYLLRDTVERRFGARLAEIDRGIARDGAFYLLSLRLVPLFPFFVINLLMGLTRMKTATFYGVSQLGMLPATVVFVNAGTQLAQLTSVKGILSPALLGSFVLLGVFPLIAARVVSVLRTRRVYAPWRHLMPRRFDRNLIVIGAGSAGLVTSYIAAAVRAKVTLVEAHRMGGDCLNTGCVPSKSLIRTASVLHEIRHAHALGITGAAGQVDFAAAMARVRDVIRRIEPHDSVARYTALGVDCVQGRARLLDPWRVEIDRGAEGTQVLTTRAIVLATGAAPIVPPLPGVAEAGVLTSETVWDLDVLPARLLVLGGGPIGCELAQCFARLGSAVTLVQRNAQLLPREDPDAAALVTDALRRDGVTVLTGHHAVRCEQEADGWRLLAEHAGETVAIPFDRVLCALGRAPRLTGYGLETLGIDTQGKLETNEFLQTRFPHILAAGDVAGPYQFTHAAAHQAWYASVNALFGTFRRFRADYAALPWTTFTDPEVAHVGLSEHEAQARGVAVEVTRYGIDDLDRAIADGNAEGFVKVLTVPGRDRILGVTIVGRHAGDLLPEFVLAMRHGLGLNKILSTVHAYPTLAEANKYAAGEWRRAHQPEALLKWIARFHTWRRG